MARAKRFGFGERIPAKTTRDTSSATPTYSYDANGNRTNPGDTIGSDNQISTDGTWTYTYDKEGNVTQKTDAAGDKWQYTYDNMNELVNATYTPHGTTVADISVTFVYDVFGDDIEQEATQNSVTTITKFAFDGTNAWAAMTSTNTLQTRYVYLDGSTTPVAQISSGGTVNGYLTDYEGSVRIIVNNSTGASVDNISYDAYGNILSESSPVAGEQAKYAGYWFLAQVDLYQTWARFYDPLTGSWMQQDPVGFAGGSTNLQEYVGNDPTGGTDPTGLIVYTDSAAAAGAYFDQVIAPELPAAGVTNLQTGYQVVSAYDDTLIQVKRVDYDPALVNEVWKVVLNLQAQTAELRGDTALAAQLRMRAGRLRVVFGGENTASIRLRLGPNGQLQGQKFCLQEYINARIRGIIVGGTKFTPFGAVASITDVAMALGENTGELERSAKLATMFAPGQPLVPGGGPNPNAPRPNINSGLPGRVTQALPPGQNRTPAENAQARNFFERNRAAAEQWYTDRTGKPWPKEATHAEHPRPLANGGDPLFIEPGFGGPNAPHMVPRPEQGGLTDFQIWGQTGGRPPKATE